METQKLLKKVRKTVAKKSRTTRRPALRKKTSSLHGNPTLLKFSFGFGYGMAVLILFHFMLVQIAFGFYLTQPAVTSARIRPVIAKTPVTQAKKVGLPVRIKIPGIRVNTLVKYVGIAKDGSMGVPKHPMETAWYMLGPKPGEQGNAVIAGHVDRLYGATGAFENLKKLKPGDEISVVDDQGTSTKFLVRSTREYDQKADTTNVFISPDEGSHLNLVTCAGVWDRITKAYTKRLVVFADKVKE